MDERKPDLIIEVTNACDRSCDGCYAPNIVVGRTEINPLVTHLSPAVVRRVLTLLEAEGSLLVYIRGGEPTLSPELGGILKLASEYAVNFVVETHGRWVLDDEFLPLLRTISETNSVVKVSYDSMHGLSPQMLKRILGVLALHEIPYRVAITEFTDERFELLQSKIPFVRSEEIWFQQKASTEQALLRPRIGVVNTNGQLKRTLTHGFQTLSALLVLIACSVGWAAKPSPTIHVPIGVAGNFSAASDSTSNPFSNHLRNGIELALKDARPQLGKRGIQIELENFDYANSNALVLASASKAIASDVVAVLGYVYSTHALLAAPLFQKSQVLLLSPTATSDGLEGIGSYFRRTTFRDSYQGEVLAKEAFGRGVRTASIVSLSNCAYCQSLRKAFIESFTKLGGTIARDETVLTDQVLTEDQLKSLKGTPADAFLIPNHERSSAKLIAQLHDNKVNPRLWLGGDGWGNVSSLFFKLMESRKIDTITVSHWHISMPSPKSRDFVARYPRPTEQTPLTPRYSPTTAPDIFSRQSVEQSPLTAQGSSRLSKVSTNTMESPGK